MAWSNQHTTGLQGRKEQSGKGFFSAEDLALPVPLQAAFQGNDVVACCFLQCAYLRESSKEILPCMKSLVLPQNTPKKQIMSIFHLPFFNPSALKHLKPSCIGSLMILTYVLADLLLSTAVALNTSLQWHCRTQSKSVTALTAQMSSLCLLSCENTFGVHMSFFHQLKQRHYQA